ncbi:GumC family protein, partial [Sphingobacterium siyangense]
MPDNLSQLSSDSQEDQQINIKALFEQYFYYWKWFVLSISIVLFSAFLYLKFATKQYKVDAKILLPNENEGKGELAGLADLASITGSAGNTAKVMDQIDVLKSRRLAGKVVDTLNLNISYSEGRFKKEMLAQQESPIRLFLVNSNISYQDTIKGRFRVDILSPTKVILEDEFGKNTKEILLGTKVKSSLGEIILLPQTPIIQSFINKSINITVLPRLNALENLVKDINVTPNQEKQSYIINFSTTSASVLQASKIINELINQYNIDLTQDKDKLTKATSKFINERLDKISGDLSHVDSKAESFKEGNRLIDVESEAKLFLENASESDKKVVEQRTQLQLVDYMKQYVQSNNTELLPTNIGLQDLSIEKTIAEYNKMVLERDGLLKSSTIDNPVIKNINDNIRVLNNNVIKSLNNYRNVTQLALNSAQAKKSELQGKLSNLPKQERGFKDISREQQIVESLYLFLLQKREENEIKAAATPDNLKIIDEAFGSNIPVSPKKSIVLLGALIVGVILPFGILYLKFLLDNKIQSRKDIEDLIKAPILGEIPRSDHPIIQENDRSSLAEAFRILRTNMSFMLGPNKNDSKVIFITSTTSGEGKSFVSTNLAKILAMSGKKVLLIGADIRSPKVLDYLGLA